MKLIIGKRRIMDGIIVIDKPEGYTSQDVVSKVKKILKKGCNFVTFLL